MSSDFDTWMKNVKDAEIFDDINKSWKQFVKLLEAAVSDAGTRTIEVKIKGSSDAKYKTEIELDGDIRSEFPSDPPKDVDVYWKRHKELVDEALAVRKEIALKVIETVGTTIKGVINPISVANIDIVKIIEALSKKE